MVTTWLVGMCFIIIELLKAPEYDHNERPVKKDKVV